MWLPPRQRRTDEKLRDITSDRKWTWISARNGENRQTGKEVRGLRAKKKICNITIDRVVRSLQKPGDKGISRTRYDWAEAVRNEKGPPWDPGSIYFATADELSAAQKTRKLQTKRFDLKPKFIGHKGFLKN